MNEFTFLRIKLNDSKSNATQVYKEKTLDDYIQTKSSF